jgi:excisionase family DNA binding protein
VKGKKQTACKRALHELDQFNSQRVLRTSTTFPKDQRAISAEPGASGPYNILLALGAIRRLMTVNEVAELLTNSACTIYRMVRHNEIPHVMIGGSLRFDPSALAAWLAKKEPELARVAYQLAHAA